MYIILVYSKRKAKIRRFLSVLYGYYLDNFNEVPQEFKKNYNNNTEAYHQENSGRLFGWYDDRFAKNIYESLGNKMKKIFAIKKDI